MLELALFSFPRKKKKSSVKFCPWKSSLPHLKSILHSTVLRTFVYRFIKWHVNTDWIFSKALLVPCQSFRNTFLPFHWDFSTDTLCHTSFLNLKAHLLHNKKNNSTLNCTHNNFLTDLHLLTTSWNGSELKKRKSK